MENDFCTALAKKDQPAIKKAMDPLFGGLEMRGGQQSAFESIQKWIEQHDCVESVEQGAGMLRSEPPLKEFIVRIKGRADDAPVRIKVTVYPDKLLFHSS